MEDVYEIHYLEFVDRCGNTENIQELLATSGIEDITKAFYVGQSFSANPPVSAQRIFLSALGYDFGEDQTVTIVA